MTKINMDELLADRAAGTDEPWFLDDYSGVCAGSFAVADTRFGVREDHEECANARRIARLPDLEAADIEAVKLVSAMANFQGGMWALQDDARAFLDKHS